MISIGWQEDALLDVKVVLMLIPTWKTYLLNRWFTYASPELRIELYFALQVSKLPISPQERRRNIIFRQVRYKGYLEQSQQFQAINSFPEEIMRLEGNVGKEKLDLL